MRQKREQSLFSASHSPLCFIVNCCSPSCCTRAVPGGLLSAVAHFGVHGPHAPVPLPLSFAICAHVPAPLPCCFRSSACPLLRVGLPRGQRGVRCPLATVARASMRIACAHCWPSSRSWGNAGQRGCHQRCQGGLWG